MARREQFTLWAASLTALVSLSSLAPAGADDDFTPLFNGRDLAGWVPVNVAPNTFTVREGIIVSTGIPTGVLRTERMYENFELELEWRHMKAGGNAGLFVWSDPLTARGQPFTRAIEVQVLDGVNTDNYTSHGDIFPIHGARMTPDHPHPAGWARCLPSERRCKPAGEWNHYRVVCRDGKIDLAVNGKVVSGGGDCSPRKGYICLEAEGSECHFRGLKIRELPSSNPPAEHVARVAEPWVSLYTGVDLAGWREPARHAERWRASDWTLRYAGGAAPQDDLLRTEREWGDFQAVLDWRWVDKPQPRKFTLPGNADSPEGTTVETLDAGETELLLRGSPRGAVRLGCHPQGSGALVGQGPGQAFTPSKKADAPPGQWNRMVVTLRRGEARVVVNDQVVIDGAKLADLPDRGPLALRYGRGNLHVANLFVLPLE